MKPARAALATAAALLSIACHAGAAPPGGAVPVASFTSSVRPDECGAGSDADVDGLSDRCEMVLARAFAPVLMQDRRDCMWDRDARRIVGGYLHAVQRATPSTVRIAYLPAYTMDCGWHGAKCILPGVDCDAHAGDSEALVVEIEARAESWSPSGVFLSAHCFDGEAKSCRWYRGDELRALRWQATRPVVWVSAGRHANYASRAACERGHYRLDTCDFAPVSIDFPVDAERNLGSATAPAQPGGCVPAPAGAARGGAFLECFWRGDEFRGWHADAPGVTSYLRYLDEVAGFVAPIERLGWLAGCWERSSATGSMEEQWMAPRAGIMLGMGRVIRDGAVVAHEAMRIEQRGDTLVFVANPSGQAQAEFTATTIERDAVVFENPEHDFPQRVAYRHAAGDSLHARIEGTMDGSERGIDFRMGRAVCAS